MKSTHFCTLPIAPNMIALALEETRAFSTAARLGDDAWKLAIIVEELLFNLVDYGSPPAGAEVTLAFEAMPGGVRLVLTDPCVPYDPRGRTQAALPPDRGGGAGLALVAAWSTIEHYAHEGGRNRTTLHVPC